MRTEAGLTCEDVGRELERSDSWVSRVETARQTLRPRDLADLLDLYQVRSSDVRRELELLARDSKERRWWNQYGSSITSAYASYIGFEDEATALSCYDLLFINGLLQTEEYARGLQRQAVPPVDGAESERFIEVRLTRQQRLESDRPLEVHIVMDESVLQRRFTEPDVHRRQLEHLIGLAERLPHLTLRVLPLHRSLLSGMSASFTICEFAPPDLPIVFNETVTGMSMEDGTAAGRYRTVFDALRDASLNKEESLMLIRDMVVQIT
jgi:hypothetical protein